MNSARRGELLSVLRSTDLFALLPEPALAAVASEVEWHRLQAGEVLLRKGDPGDALYLLVRGRLRVYIEDASGDVVLSECAPGEVVGELAVLSDEPRAASVRAVRDSELLRLSADAFHRIVARAPEALLQLTRKLVAKIQDPAVRRPIGRVRTVALVPAGTTPAAAIRPFATDLVRALAAYGPVAEVDEAMVDREVGPDGNVVELLDRVERQNDFVIYHADEAPSAWTDRCVRQVDRVLLVAGPGARRTVGSAETAAGLARRDLVLLHRAGTAWPEGTAAWFEGRPVADHHHVRLGHSPDHDRLARRLAGRAVGLVLGGGGPRGFAHLGAIRALEEAGIPIDAVGGTSIGSLMAGAVAFEWDHATRVERLTYALAGQGSLFRPTLPLVAFSSGRRVTNLLRQPEYLGDRQIEDFWCPWFCVSTNLTKGRPVVHDRGPAWRAVRASVALPGVLPPVYDNGDLLVDGGVLDNLPVDVMRTRIDGSIIAVDLEPDVDLRFEHAFEPTLSGWHVLARRWHPLRPRFDVPNAVQLLLLAKQVGISHGQRAILATHPVEIYLRPPADTIGGLSFRGAANLVELGYKYAAEFLEHADVSDLLPPKRG